VSTPHEVERIRMVRERAKYLVAIGACATSGGIQALRNLHRAEVWKRAVYASPEHISVLDRVDALSSHVRVDLELWGCPVNAHQVLGALHDLLAGVSPAPGRDKLCLECKRIGTVCVVVAQAIACIGGFHRAPAPEAVSRLRSRLHDAVPLAEELVRWTASLALPHSRQQFVSVALRHPTEYPLNEGRIVASDGLDIPVAEYPAHFC
jgi:hypothetical protein